MECCKIKYQVQCCINSYFNSINGSDVSRDIVPYHTSKMSIDKENVFKDIGDKTKSNVCQNGQNRQNNLLEKKEKERKKKKAREKRQMKKRGDDWIDFEPLGW